MKTLLAMVCAACGSLAGLAIGLPIHGQTPLLLIPVAAGTLAGIGIAMALAQIRQLDRARRSNYVRLFETLAEQHRE